MSIPLPPHEAAPLVVPVRDVLLMIAILVVLAIASNLCLLAYLAAHIHFPSGSPSPGDRECAPREAGSLQFTPLPLAEEGPGVGVPPHAH